VNVGSYEFSVLSVTLGVYLNCVTIPIYQEDMYNIVEQNVIRLYNAWLAWFTMVFIRFYIFVGATCFYGQEFGFPSIQDDQNPILFHRSYETSHLVGGFKHFLFSISYMG
jgi:hypothetical protein